MINNYYKMNTVHDGHRDDDDVVPNADNDSVMLDTENQLDLLPLSLDASCSEDIEEPPIPIIPYESSASNEDDATSCEEEAEALALKNHDECAICLEKLTNANISVLPCLHCFHDNCLGELRETAEGGERNSSCPLCRALLPPRPETLCREASDVYFAVKGRIASGDIVSWDKLGEHASEEMGKALTFWRAAAFQGHAGAQNSLGFLYDQGYGVEQNEYEAFEWFHRAALRGQAKAQYNLALMYDMGQGVKQSDEGAAKWYHSASLQEYAPAQYNYALMHETGQHVEKNYGTALKWYRKAANHGDPDAQVSVGRLYQEGLGVRASSFWACRYYKRAALQGHPLGQFYLGLMYEGGQGVDQSDSKAAEWFLLSALQGHPPAQFNLGYMYDHSRGVRHSKKEACRWYTLAAQQGHTGAETNLSILEEDNHDDVLELELPAAPAVQNQASKSRSVDAAEAPLPLPPPEQQRWFSRLKGAMTNLLTGPQMVYSPRYGGPRAAARRVAERRRAQGSLGAF